MLEAPYVGFLFRCYSNPQSHPLYEEGVSCAACYDERTDEQRASARERDRQEKLARARGRSHIGAVLSTN